MVTPQHFFFLQKNLLSSLLKKIESHNSTAVRAAILCPVVCVCDIIDKASMRGTSHITSRFVCFSMLKNKSTWLHPEQFKFQSKKVLLLHKYQQKNHLKPAKGKHLHIIKNISFQANLGFGLGSPSISEFGDLRQGFHCDCLLWQRRS